MKKYRIAAAITAVLLLAISFSLTAYAAGSDELPEDMNAAADVEPVENPEDDKDIIPDDPTISAVDENNLTAPPGTGTVVEHGINGDNKEFYTIMTADEYVFYLIIDHERTGQNVHFLNAVTIYDLMALAEQDEKTGNTGSVSAIPDGNANAEKPKTDEPTTTPTPEPDPKLKSGGNMGMIIFIVVVLLAGGGFAYYFKIIRPKQQGAYNGGDDDYSEDDVDPYGGDDIDLFGNVENAETESENDIQNWFTGEENNADDYSVNYDDDVDNIGNDDSAEPEPEDDIESWFNCDDDNADGDSDNSDDYFEVAINTDDNGGDDDDDGDGDGDGEE